MGKTAQQEKDRGREDARQGRYEPPAGKGFAEIVIGQIFGRGDKDKTYHDGYKKGK